MNTEELTKNRKLIIDTFGCAAVNYHREAEVQWQVANGLMASLQPWKNILPRGPLLEIGCGTGFLTELLIGEFPGREMVISDASPQMLKQVRENVPTSDTIDLRQLNVDTYTPEEEKYSLICSNFTVQWFEDVISGLKKLVRSLKPGGILLVSFPGNKSFPEWWNNCLELGLPFTANPLPDVEEVVIKLSLEPVQVDFYEDTITQNFESAFEFFKHLKNVGASANLTGKSLTPKQMKLLIEHWNRSSEQKIEVSWHTVYLAAKKDV